MKLVRLWVNNYKNLRNCEIEFSQPFLLNAVRETLRDVRDVERILGRLSQVNGNARDVMALRLSLECLPDQRRSIHLLPLRRHVRRLEKLSVQDNLDGLHCVVPSTV